MSTVSGVFVRTLPRGASSLPPVHQKLDEKFCSRCRRQLPAAAFSQDASKRSRLSGRCKECHAAAKKAAKG